MKKSIFTALLAFIITISFISCNNTMPNGTSFASKTTEKKVYTCSMHPEIRTDKPGDCPKCGMKLVVMETADTMHINNQSDTTHMKL